MPPIVLCRASARRLKDKPPALAVGFMTAHLLPLKRQGRERPDLGGDTRQGRDRGVCDPVEAHASCQSEASTPLADLSPITLLRALLP